MPWGRAAFICLALFAALLLFGCTGRSDEKALRKAEALLAADKGEEARQAFEGFIRSRPDSPLLPFALFGLASAEHLQLKDYDSALAIYTRLTLLFPRHQTAPLALERLADIYLNNLKDYQAAIGVLERLRDEYGQTTGRADEYQDQIAWAYILSEDYDAARQACQKLVDEHPDSPLAERAYVRLAESYYVQEMTPQALAAYREALERFPEGQLRGRIIFRLANCLEETGQTKEARRLYQELLTSYENPEAVRIRLKGLEARLNKEGR